MSLTFECPITLNIPKYKYIICRLSSSHLSYSGDEALEAGRNLQTPTEDGHGVLEVAIAVEGLRLDPDGLHADRVQPQHGLRRPLGQVEVPKLGEADGLGGHDVPPDQEVVLLHVGVEGEAEVEQGVGVVAVPGEELGLAQVHLGVVSQGVAGNLRLRDEVLSK